MSRPRCFAEFPAGLASVSLRLHGGPGCRPPISRMGNKAGYAETILWTLGLTAGKSAGAYVWAEADDDVRALLRAYPDPALLLQIAEIIRGWADEEPRALWERLRAERKARGPRVDADPAGSAGAEFATPAGDVAGAFEIAAHSFLHQGSFGYKGPEAGIGRPEGMEAHDTHGAIRPVTAILGDSFPRIASSWPTVAVLPRIPSAADLALWLGTPGDLDGVVVYMDPPYLDTTGYLHDLGRADVVRHALDFASMGAHVAISEAVALPELMALGWHVADITGGRKGQKRTFSKQQGEYLTMNREPAYVVPAQAGLFACAS